MSRQDLRSWIGMELRAQVALEENIIAFRTSTSVAGEKNDKDGGGNCGESAEILWHCQGQLKKNRVWQSCR